MVQKYSIWNVRNLCLLPNNSKVVRVQTILGKFISVNCPIILKVVIVQTVLGKFVFLSFCTNESLVQCANYSLLIPVLN